MSEQKVDLPFNASRQNAFLGYLITDKSKYHQIKDKIKKSWFEESWTGEAFEIYRKWSEKHDPHNEKIPSFEEVTSSNDFMCLDQAKQLRLRGSISSAIAAKATFDWDSILSELTSWLKCRIYLENVTKSTELFNGRKFNEAFGILEKSVQQYQNIQFFNDESADFLDWREHFESSEKERQNALTTGLTIMDQQIDPACKKGCLLPGDTTLFIASSGVGKTTAMITLAVSNMFQGKSVLFITHEDRKKNIMDKMWCNVTKKTKPELLSLYKTEEMAFKSAAYFLNDRMTYLHIIDPEQMTVENVASVIEKKQAERILKEGKGYDLLVIDYPSKLQAQQSNKVHMQFRQVEHYVYNYFVQLALKHNFHAVLAIQTNREASKNNKHQGKYGTQNRLIMSEDVSEAWGPITVATNVISINRNDTYGEKVIFHICKTRSNITGISILAKSDYGRAISHSDNLGGLWYKGNTSIAAITPELLNQYLNQSLPEEKVYEIEE